MNALVLAKNQIANRPRFVRDGFLANEVELQPKEIAGETVYCIIIGAYQYKSQARDFLNYLNRNDLTGQIVEINGE